MDNQLPINCQSNANQLPINCQSDVQIMLYYSSDAVLPKLIAA